jgi:hypothetical protein
VVETGWMEEFLSPAPKECGLARAAVGPDLKLEPFYAGCPTPVLPCQDGSSKEEIDLDAPGARFEDRVGGGG